MLKVPRIYFNKIWLSLAAINLVLIFLFPDWFSRESISSFLGGLGAMSLIVYTLISMGRAFFLIPSTPFIIAGAITFPESPAIVWSISSGHVWRVKPEVACVACECVFVRLVHLGSASFSGNPAAHRLSDEPFPPSCCCCL